MTGNKNDSLKFKVPSLKNIQLTAPYVHDGRLFTLLQVLTHYTGKINITQPTLHPLLQHKIVITNQEKVDLMSFLYILTDEELTNKKRYGSPDVLAINAAVHNH